MNKTFEKKQARDVEKLAWERVHVQEFFRLQRIQQKELSENIKYQAIENAVLDDNARQEALKSTDFTELEQIILAGYDKIIQEKIESIRKTNENLADILSMKANYELPMNSSDPKFGIYESGAHYEAKPNTDLYKDMRVQHWMEHPVSFS